MSYEMRKCPECGEEYDIMYRQCPFCGEGLKKGRRLAERQRRRGPGPGPIVAIVIIIVAAVLAVLTFVVKPDWLPWDGDAIFSSQQQEEQQDPEAGNAEDPNAGEDPDPGTEEPPIQILPGDEDLPPTLPSGPDDPIIDDAPPNEAASLALAQTDITLTTLGEAVQLRLTEGEGADIVWLSSDPAIVQVDQEGRILAVTNGTATVYATSGSLSAGCTVRVRAEDVPPPGESILEISRTDMTLALGESWTLKITGSVSTPTWQSGDSSVATVSAEGRVTGISNGTTKITARVDGQTLECIVRVR